MRYVQRFIIFSLLFLSTLQCMFGLSARLICYCGRSDIRFYFLDWFSWKWNGKSAEEKKNHVKGRKLVECIVSDFCFGACYNFNSKWRFDLLCDSESYFYSTYSPLALSPLRSALYLDILVNLVFSFIHCEKTGAWILDSVFCRKEWDSMRMNVSGMRLLSRFCSSFGEVYYAVWKEAEHNNN